MSSSTRISELYKVHYDHVVSKIESGNIILTDHVKERMRDRAVTASMIKKVLLCGKYDSGSDRWDKDRGSWKFSFYGVIGKKKLHVSVAPSEDGVVVITVVDRLLEEKSSIRPGKKAPPKMSLERYSDESFDSFLQKRMKK